MGARLGGAAHESPDLVATATAIIDPSVASDDASETEITVPLTDSESVSTFEFSCFGHGSMRFAVMVRQGSHYVDVSTADALECASGPHEIAAPERGLSSAPVNEIMFTGFETSDQSAWGAVAHR